MKRGLGILFAGVLSVSAIQFGARGGSNDLSRPSRRSPSESSIKAPGPDSVQCPDFGDDLLGAIREFYKVPGKLQNFSAILPKKATVRQKRRQEKQQKGPEQKPQFLIAILPDPVHTHLSLFFDRNIEMIGQAAQTQGYIFDRQVLPWDNKSHPEPADFRIRNKEKTCTDQREDFPGLLIFRKEKDPLFVFVVGEQPTGGINYLQFHKALEMVHKMDSALPSLRILGPTFSGSLYSLDKILRKTDEGLPGKIYVHSGTVTSWAAADQFIKAWQGDNASPPGRTVEFVTFQESDQYRLRHFLRYYIAAHGYRPDEVAQVSEGETAYGSFLPQATNSHEKQQVDPCQPNPYLSGDKAEACVLHLYFPREISQLRSAYQRDIYMDQGTGNTGKSAPRSTLKLDFDNVGNDGDSIPSYSGKQLPLSQESVLLSIVMSLKKHHSRFVVLRATDPLDELFLGRFLRQAYPDGRIITLGADLLYNRQEDNLLHGVWAMSSYPLITDMHKMLPLLGESDSETTPHVDRNFPFSYGVGTYNATLSLLANGGALIPNPQASSAGGPYLPPAPYEQYGWPSLGGDTSTERLRTPPVWLSVMGRDGYWPMALLDDAKSPKANGPPSRLHEVEGQVTPGRYEMSSPDSWSVLCGLCVLLAMIHLLLVWSGSSMSRSEAFAQFAPHTNWRRIGLLFLAAASILSVLEVLIALDTEGVRRTMLIVAAIVFTTGCFIDLARRSLNSGQTRNRVSGAEIMLGSPIFHLIWITSLTLVIYKWAVIARSSPSSWRIFLYRSVHITSAVSPVIPVLLLLGGLYWCVWHCLSGASLLDRRRPRLPEAARNSGAPQNGGIPSGLSDELEFISIEDTEDLRRVAKPFTFDPRIAFPIIVLGAVISFMFNYRNRIEGLESRDYDYIYAGLLFLMVGLLLSNLFRLLAIWLECRHLLVALDRLPLRRAFRKLNGFSWKPIWRPGGSAFRDSFRMIFREIECLSHLKTVLEKALKADPALSLADPERCEKHEALIRTISGLQENEYKKLLSKYHQRDASLFQWNTLSYWSGWRALIVDEPKQTAALVECFKQLQGKLAAACGMALNFVRQLWEQEEELVANEGKEFLLCKEVQLAEEYVALVYASFIMNVLLRMRTLIMCVSGLFVFILLSINSYPFQPQSAFRLLLVGMFVLIGCVVGSVYAQMHRDATLSLLTDTTPGKLGSEFWIKLAGFGAVPLVSLVASQFPEVNRFLFSWLQPALEALK